MLLWAKKVLFPKVSPPPTSLPATIYRTALLEEIQVHLIAPAPTSTAENSPVDPAGHIGCSRPAVDFLRHMFRPAADTAHCTVRIAPGNRCHGRSPLHLGFALGFRAVGTPLRWSWALCIHLFRQSRRLDQYRLVCCPGHDLLESSGHRTCANCQRQGASVIGLSASLRVVHSLECFIRFRFG